MALGPDGSLFVADTMNHVIRKITPDGNIYTVVGNGQAGFQGDGGPPAQAELNQPYGLTVAANGDIYIADTQNHRIREVSAHFTQTFPTPKPRPTPAIIPCTDEVGSICTYAGSGEQGFNGNGLTRLPQIFTGCSTLSSPPAVAASSPTGTTIKIREILPDDTVTTIMGTNFVGDGPPDFSDYTLTGADPLEVNLNHPTDVQELPSGDLMVMCWHNHKIRVLEGHQPRALSSSVPGRLRRRRWAGYDDDGIHHHPEALINQPPHGVLDPNGNFFFIDQRNQRIRVLYNFVQDRENSIIDTVVGDGRSTAKGRIQRRRHRAETQLNFPTGANPEPSGGLALDPR